MKKEITSAIRHIGAKGSAVVRKAYLYALLLGCGWGINSCIEPFSPPEVNNPDSFLVVDGFLNVNGDTSEVILSGTQNTFEPTLPLREGFATVSVESENGETYFFTETNIGVYKLPPENFNTSQKYRLHIRRAQGGEYYSDYVVVSNTPEIDSVTYRLNASGTSMMVYVNAHDATNATRFYRWKFEETYQYRAAYHSSLIVDQATKRLVLRNEDINLCWRTLQSRDIKLGSTIKLSQDIIKDVPVNVIDISTNKLFFGYSILVKQYGLSKEAFEYWTDLAKTTQGTGSLFDPQPSQVTGNIKNAADNKELVFGYFSAAVERSQRIFIREGLGRYPTCMAPDSLTEAEAVQSPSMLLSYFRTETKAGVLASSEFCADCRVQGGVTRKPSFWID